MQKQLILSIQNQLEELTHKKFSQIYVKKYIYPIFEFIVLSKKKKFLISGSQGIGKSTLLRILKKNLNLFYKKKILSLSLDDYYLKKNERIFLSDNVHPLFSTRGVPGTHDVKMLLKNIIDFEKSRYPFKIPIFNKLNDERSNKFKSINSKKDILLLEGWCCGCPPVKKSYLLKNINLLEKKRDNDCNWRKFYNQKLRNEYAQVFNHFNSIIYIKPSSFSYVSKWRFRQEKMMKAENFNKQTMNKKQVIEFIQYYEKITKWMIKKMPSISNLTIYVDTSQKIKKIKWKH